MASLGYYLSRLGLHFARETLLFFETPLGRETALCHDPGPHIRPVSTSQLRSLEEFGGWLTREKAANLLAQNPGWRLLVALDGNRVLGSCWEETGTALLPILHLEPRLVPGDCHINHVHVSSNARAMGLASQLVIAATRDAAVLGCRRAILCCVPGNVPMLRMMRSLGWRHFQTARYLRVAAFRRYHLEPANPGHAEVHYSSSAAAERVVRAGSCLVQ